MLSGSFPVELTNLTQLTEVDLSNNGLNGTVPSGLCGGSARMSLIRGLIISNNRFEGVLDIPSCESLVYLDVQVSFIHVGHSCMHLEACMHRKTAGSCCLLFVHP